MAIMFAIFFALSATGQINSPYSRYALGDLYNSRNVVNKAMGNVATCYADYQTVNFINPASYATLQTVTFDVGIETEIRSLYNQQKTDRSQSANLTFNYMAFGAPLAKDKKGNTYWGLAFGLKPYTRISYSILERTRLAGIDSTNAYYSGNGGANKAYIGMGFRVKGLSVGFNLGYLFGQQDINSERTFINDSVYYLNSYQQTKTSFQHFGFDYGIQYKLKLGKQTFARIGANGMMGGTVQAKQDILRQTFNFGSTGIDSIDVVQRQLSKEGTIILPGGLTTGLSFEKEGKWMIGGEYEKGMWDDYRFFGQKDQVANSEIIRIGGYIVPAATDANNYAKRVTYRAGFFTGKDLVVANGEQLPLWGITTGLGLPIRRYNIYSNQYTAINLSFEYSHRGNSNSPLSENFFRINFGLNLADLWFIKHKYD